MHPLLYSGPGQVTGLCGEGAGKAEVICLGPCEVNEPLLAVGLEASLGYVVPVTLTLKGVKAHPCYWLAPHSSSAACLDTGGPLEE